MVISVRQYIFNLQRLCSTEETTTRTNIFVPFLLLFTANYKWTGNKTLTPYGLCTLTFHLISSVWKTWFILNIKVMVEVKTWFLFTLNYVIWLLHNRRVRFHVFTYGIHTENYTSSGNCYKGVNEWFYRQLFLFWLIVEHIVMSNCLNKINSKNWKEKKK